MGFYPALQAGLGKCQGFAPKKRAPTDRLRIGLSELCSSRGQPVNIRSLVKLASFLAVAFKPNVIRHDHDHIRFSLSVQTSRAQRQRDRANDRSVFMIGKSMFDGIQVSVSSNQRRLETWRSKSIIRFKYPIGILRAIYPYAGVPMQESSHSPIRVSASILVVVAVIVTTFQLTIGKDQLFAAAPEPSPTVQSEKSDSTVQRDDDLSVAAKGPTSQRVEALLRLSDGRFPAEKVVPIMARATADRAELVRAAGEVGIQRIGKKAVPILSSMISKGYLDSPDFPSVCGAARVLGTDAVELFPEMQKALSSDLAPIQKTALFGMQSMGDVNAKAMDRMIELLDSKDLNVQVSVCKVLEQLGPKAAPATDKLVEVFGNGTVSARSWASIVLGSIGESDKHDILGLLKERLNAFTLIEKQRAMIGLSHMGAKAQPAVEKVTQLMMDPTKSCQTQAAVTLWQITGKSKASLNVMKTLLTTIDHKMTVLEQAANLGPAAAPLASSIAKELASDDVGIRELAAVALGKIGPGAKQTLPQLKKLLKDDDALLRQAVTDAIAAIEKAPELP